MSKKENSTEVVEEAEYPSSTSHFQEAVAAGAQVVVEAPHIHLHKTVVAADPIHLHSTQVEALLEPVEDP